MLKITSTITLAVLCLFLCCNSQAQDTSQVRDELLLKLRSFPFAYQAYIDAKLDDALHILDAQASAHQDDADYFNLVGVLKLKKKEYAAAANMFERVVLIDHDNAGAWMDLAIATFESGNIVSAQSYFEYIETQFQPSSSIQKLVDAYKKRIALQSQAPKSWHGMTEFHVGHDTNANSGLQSSAIPITFGGETVNLPLDLSLKARADQFMQAAASGSYRYIDSNNLVELGAGLKQRSYQQEKAFSSAEVAVNANWQRWTSKGIIALGIYADHSQLSGQSLLNNMRLNLTWDQQWKTCRYGLGSELEWRRYLALQSLNANIVWMQIAGFCQTELIGHDIQISTIARYGIDEATGLRSGADARRKEGMLQIVVPISSKLSSQLSANFSSSLDAHGYSNLLENNARRQLTRKSYSWQLTALLNTNTSFIFRIEKNIIQSNLPLFNQAGASMNLGVKMGF